MRRQVFGEATTPNRDQRVMYVSPGLGNRGLRRKPGGAFSKAILIAGWRALCLIHQ